MALPSPLVLIDGQPQINGYNAIAGATVFISLASNAGVYGWSLQCIGTDELNTAAAVNATLVINPASNTATFTMPDGYGSAVIFKSTVNNGQDINGLLQSIYTTTFGVFVLSESGNRVGAQNQTLEGDAIYGWLSNFNEIARSSFGTSVTFGGDLAGSSSSQTVLNIHGTSVPASPSANQVLVATSSSSSTWEQISNAQIASNAAIGITKLVAGTSGQILLNNATPTPTWTSLSGDITISPTGLITVTALQNNAVASGILGSSQDGYALVWKNSSNMWQAQPIEAAVTLLGDVTGAASSNTVIKLQGHAVAATAPSTNYVLEWNGSAWTPTALPAALPPNGSAGGDLSGTYPNPTVSTSGGHTIITNVSSAGGDLSGTYPSPTVATSNGNTIITNVSSAGGDLSGTYPNPTVIKIANASVPSAGSLVSGNVLQVNGSSALTYAPVNLAGGSNYISGLLPTANQTNQSMGGDVSGTTASSTVVALQGNAVLSQSLGVSQDGYVLTWHNAGSTWEALASSGGGGGGFTAGGDLSGSSSNQTVIGIQGNPIESGILGSSQDGYSLVWNNAATQWQPKSAGSIFFRSNGTWICPSGVYFITLIGSGGGNGGNGGTLGSGIAAGNGGAGGTASAQITNNAVPVTPGTSYTITIGAGGTAGIINGGTGGTGVATSFAGGVLGTISFAAAGGAAGGATSSNGSNSNYYTGGTAGTTSNGTGGGGGGAGTLGNGGAGGNGGGSPTTAGSNANANTGGGGGGGGGGNNTGVTTGFAGGTGGSGYLWIQY